MKKKKIEKLKKLVEEKLTSMFVNVEELTFDREYTTESKNGKKNKRLKFSATYGEFTRYIVAVELVEYKKPTTYWEAEVYADGFMIENEKKNKGGN